MTHDAFAKQFPELHDSTTGAGRRSAVWLLHVMACPMGAATCTRCSPEEGKSRKRKRRNGGTGEITVCRHRGDVACVFAISTCLENPPIARYSAPRRDPESSEKAGGVGVVEIERLLEDLTPPQRAAATHVDGPLLIVAGAGSGKTRVITRRVAYLIAQGVRPSSILAITFTNKASAEMKQRVASVMDRPLRDFGRLDQPWPMICTFHSLCLRILRHYAERVGLAANFSIFDTSDQTKLVKEAVKMLDINTANFPAGTLHASISNAKNQLIDAEAFARKTGDFYQRTVARVYTKYQQLLKQNNALDFDDLLLRTAHAMRDYPDVLHELQDRFQYLLIDEYQDTNHAQYVLAHALALRHQNLCVVGDPDQCLPPGIMISTPDGDRPIELLRDGDAVCSSTGWGKTAAMTIDKAVKKNFRGKLVKITTVDGFTLRGTPNHIGFARLRAHPDVHYTYLMWKRNVGYRIGTTRGVRTSKTRVTQCGLQVRTNQEVADAVWILRISPTSAEARFHEQYFSVRFGIPTMIFFVRGRKTEMTQDLVDRLFAGIDTSAGAERLMEELCLNREYPHHRPGAVTRGGLGAETAPWSRRHVMFTVFGDGRPSVMKRWHEHRVQLVTSHLEMRKAATGRFNVREGMRGSWRIETSRKHYDDGLALARDIASLDEEVEIVSRARLTTEKPFLFMPLSHIHPGMAVAVCKDGKVIDSVVASVESEDYDGPVYDLSVPNTRNYVAGGIVVHNSIYAWRGADLQNILDFEKDYPNAKIIRLEQNYRSTKRILRIASELIARNLQRKEKTLWTENAEGEMARMFLCQDEHDEAAIIMQQLRDLHDKHGYDWNKMAIFYRMNSLSRVMEGALLNAGIPYQIARGTEFYNRKEIKDVLAYLRVIANPSDEVSLSRIVNVPARGLGDAALKLISAYAAANGISLWEGLENASRVQGVSTRAGAAAGQFVQLVKRWRKMAFVLDGNEKSGIGGTPMSSTSSDSSSATATPTPQATSPSENTAELAVPRGSASSIESGLFPSDADDPFGPTDSATLDEIDLENSGSSDDADAGEPAPDESPAAPAPIRGRVRAITEAVIRQSGLEAYLKKIGGEELDEFHNVEELITSTAEFDNENPKVR
jgi:DNA helicase-2/ATP-dependent DNA helicase PcrA